MKIEELKEWCRDNLFRTNGKININQVRKDYKFYKENIDIFNQIEELVNISEDRLARKIYCLLDDVFETPKCYCRKDNKYNHGTNKYSTYCSSRCASKHPDVRSKRSESVKQAFINRGDEIVTMNKATMLERYGDENYRNSKKALETWHNNTDEYKLEVKLKRQETKLEKYGDRFYHNSEKAQETIKSYGEEFQKVRYEKVLQTKLNDIDKNGLNGLSRSSRKAQPKRLKTMNRIGKDGLTGFQRSALKCIETKYNDIDENGLNAHQRSSIKAVETKRPYYYEIGKWIHPDLKDDYELYKFNISNSTEKSYQLYYDFINPNNVNRSRPDLDENAHHLDHIISKKYGFDNNIPIWIICHPCNLQMLHYSENCSKGSDCHHSLDELMDKIKDFEIK